MRSAFTIFAPVLCYRQSDSEVSVKRNCTNYYRWILPILFIVYYGCVSFSAHIHIENGQVIVHSHLSPKQSQNIPHQHDSMEEIVLFQCLSAIQAVDGAVQTVNIEGLYPSSLISGIFDDTKYHLFHLPGKSSPRAPPIA